MVYYTFFLTMNLSLQLQVLARNEQAKTALQKVWVNIYSSKLSDEEIRRLASKHNTENRGSVQTKWFERVTACRQWLYRVAGKDFHQDETPASTREWKKACQTMYIALNKVVLDLFFGFHFISFDSPLLGKTIKY